MIIKIEVLGEPKSQLRHRTFRMGERMGSYDPSSKDKKNFLSQCMEKTPEKPIDQPINLEVRFYFARLKGHYGTGRNTGNLKDSAPKYHISRPDIDNLCKLIFDSLNKIFWRDDSLICSIKALKLYSENPRTEIYIQTL